MKKFISIISFCLAFSVFIVTVPVKAAYQTGFDIYSEAALLVNTDTDEIIFEKNADKPIYPASLTKIMTAIIALEKDKDNLDRIITAPSYIFDDLWKLNASTAGIMHKEEMSVKDLLHALIMKSACEAGSILADYYGNGSIPNFVEQMNAKAVELGCTNTKFVNAHGLFEPDQVSTARDLYKITKYAMSLPHFADISNTVSYTTAPTNKHPNGIQIPHTNLMLNKKSGYYYPYMKGIKTGTLDEVGKNLITTASKDGYNYMLITLAAPIKHPNGDDIKDNLSFADHKSIYDWAFSTFQLKTIASRETILGEAKVRLSWDKDYVSLQPENDVTSLLKKDIDISSIQVITNVPEYVNAPITKGQQIGTADLKLNNQVIATVNLVAANDINRSFILFIGDNIGAFFTSTVVKIIFGLIILAIIVYIIYMIIFNKKRKKGRYKTKFSNNNYKVVTKRRFK